MFQNLLTFLRKQNYLPQHASSTNTFLFVNATTFLYKLTNWTNWYIYIIDTLQSVTLRVYNKNWNKVFMLSFFSYSFVLVLIMFL